MTAALRQDLLCINSVGSGSVGAVREEVVFVSKSRLSERTQRARDFLVHHNILWISG